jgi:hypothetical protein
MKRVSWALILLPLVAACGNSTPSGDAASSAPSTSAMSTNSTFATAVTSTSPATTSAVEPPTTGLPSTSIPPVGEVAFETTGDEVTPIDFSDLRASSMVIHSEVAGDLEGSLTAAVVSVDDSVLGFLWFEGRADTCGQGGLAIRLGTRPDGATGWEIVDGFGVGDLGSVTGGGVSTSGRYEGTIDCDGAIAPRVLSTSLLAPMPATGESAGVPLHAIQESDSRDVNPHPTQTRAPKVNIVQATYDSGVQIQIFAWNADTTPGRLRNTFLTYWFVPASFNVCGRDGIGRAIIDDVEYPEFTGAWDVPADLNDGTTGAGTFTLESDIGRIVCA